MPRTQILPFLPDVRAGSKKRLIGWLATVLGLLRPLLMSWRDRNRHRSDLFTASASVRRELAARGLDLEREIRKPFWRP